MTKHRTQFAVALAVASLSVAIAAPASAGGRPFNVDLTGAAERPGPGDPDGSGTAQLWLDPGRGTVCYELSVSNITLPATGAHIHVAPVTDPGPVVVPLTAPDATGTSSGCVDADRKLITAIIRDPEGYYVNVHTLPLYGAGAVRGQLSRSATH